VATKDNQKLRTAFWKWQFLRMNEEYRMLYQRYYYLRYEGHKNMKEEKCMRELLNIMRELYDRYVFPPLNPKYNINKAQLSQKIGVKSFANKLLHSSLAIKSARCLTMEYHEKFTEFKNSTQTKFKDKTKRELGDTKFIDLRVNLSSSIPEIKREVAQIVYKWKDYRKKYGQKN